MRGDCLRTGKQAGYTSCFVGRATVMVLMKRGTGACRWEEQAAHALLSLLTPHSHEPRSHTKHPR